MPSFVFGPNSGGLGWWWHTPGDTADKIDGEFVVRDTKVYLLLIGRLCSEQVLPFDYTQTVGEILDKLQQLQREAGDAFDLSGVLKEGTALKEKIGVFNQAVAGRKRAGPAAREANEALKRLGRLLTPINYSKVGSFDQDLAVPIPPVPILADLPKLAKLGRESDERKFLATRMKRESNKILFSFYEADRTCSEALERMK